MIRAAAASARLVQRLRARAEQIAASRAVDRRRERRRERGAPGAEWRSATALWPDFTADIASTNRTGN
ncbi:MAG: hypothetical protein U0995_10915 [Erythrobacter sp.]|nr:hypothetical protein [Erythrobacter sp.]